MCRRRGQKANVYKNRVRVLGSEEGSLCEVFVNGTPMGHVSELKYLRFVLHEAGRDGAECRRKVTREKKVAGAIRSLVSTLSF